MGHIDENDLCLLNETELKLEQNGIFKQLNSPFKYRRVYKWMLVSTVFKETPT